ncbi:MAG: thioredoxin family protein [Mycobacteriaceae bacterium]
MTIEIELLAVPDCPNEADAVDQITTAVADARVRAAVTRDLVATRVGSPTILLNGTDPFAQPDAAVGLACRLHATPHGLRGVPTLRDLRQALKRGSRGLNSRATVGLPWPLRCR